MTAFVAGVEGQVQLLIHMHYVYMYDVHKAVIACFVCAPL